MSPSKRRRLSTDDDEVSGMILLPEDVVSHVFVAPPMLQEIPPLLLVDTQSADSSNVIVALKRLCELFKMKRPGETAGINGDEDTLGVQHLKAALSLGAIRLIIVGVLRKWPENQQITILGCHCVAMLLSVATKECEGTLIVAESGGIQAMVDAIQMFPLSRLVHRQAIWALVGSLSVTTQNDTIKKSVQAFVEEMKGIQLVVSSMSLFPQDALVQCLGCDLFCTLSNAKTRPYQDAMVKAKVLSTAAVALERHLDNQQVQKSAAAMFVKMFPGDNASEKEPKAKGTGSDDMLQTDY